MIEPRYLLDTNVCIYLLAGLSEKVLARVEQVSPGELVTSAIAYAEVMRGVDAIDRSGNEAAARLFETITVIAFDVAAAERFRSMPFRRGQFDRLIAAHALALCLPLVTANPRDFADVPGLQVEDWTQ